jgi:hypothetical protein
VIEFQYGRVLVAVQQLQRTSHQIGGLLAQLTLRDFHRGRESCLELGHLHQPGPEQDCCIAATVASEAGERKSGDESLAPREGTALASRARAAFAGPLL